MLRERSSRVRLVIRCITIVKVIKSINLKKGLATRIPIWLKMEVRVKKKIKINQRNLFN